MSLLPRLAPTLFAAAAFSMPAAFAIDFKTEVQPVFRKKCFKCHSGPRAKKGLRYDDADTLADFIGDHEDAVIIPGKPLDSRLVKLTSLPRTDSHAMPPPKRGVGLSPTELTLIKQWIAEGAKLESTATGEPAPQPTAPPKLLTWTNTDGNNLQAFFVRMEGKNVVLKKEDGTEFSYPMSKLSIDSRKLATEQSIGGN